MKVVKEYSSAGCFSTSHLWSRFFHMGHKYCGLVSEERLMLCTDKDEVEEIFLKREYRCLVPRGDDTGYLACVGMKQRNEMLLYYLDKGLKEFDVQRLRLESYMGVEDMWFHRENQLLYFVFPLSVQRYNLNGDCLGVFMRPPVNTWYRALCMDEENIFLAYEQNGCICAARYDCQGSYKEKCCVGSGFSVDNMELVLKDNRSYLNLYGKRAGQLPICIELKLCDDKPCVGKACVGKTKNNICYY